MINGLKHLGFSEYEAKIYLSLLRNHPSNGNTIATLSGVPAPKVYETLRKMQEREYVFQVAGGDNGKQIRYSPIPYEELLARTKNEFLANVAFLEESLHEIASISDTNWTELFVVHGYAAALEVMRSAIMQAKSEIIMSLWCTELNELREVLEKAHERGVRIVTLTFDGKGESVPWLHFTHQQGKLIQLRHAGELNAVIDEVKTILFHSSDERSHAVVSSHPATIKTTRNYIRHDIYVNRLIHDFEEVMKERYGAELERLINDF